MHLVHLETGRNLYGGPQQVLYLLNGLAQRGIGSTLICPPGSAIGTAAGSAGVTVETLPMAGDLDGGFGLRFGRWLADREPDLLHVHSRRGADIWGGLAAKRAGIPAVVSRRVDSPEIPLLGAIKYGMYERVIAISTAIAGQLTEAGVGAEKLRVVHSAIGVAPDQPRWSKDQFQDAFALEPDALAVVCVAQLIARKGHAVLLDAWPEIRRQCPQARLILFGKGKEEAGLRARVESLGCSASVSFAGFRADLHDFLPHADLLVHPALREGLGICLLEAQALGVPVVASRVGGIPEAVADGIAGLLVPPRDPGALAASVAALLGDAERRASFAAAGRRYVAENYSVDSMVSGNLAVYEELLNSRSTPS
ncbi:MAG: glycosyltransferase family 4 protein [Gammaproteobacteria bacterium]|jgi:glycosyltransferase involved in cell wall biosynthesis